MDKTKKLVDILYDKIIAANKICFFGGAGVSTASGIPDFRSKDGLYNQKYKFPPEIILSNKFFNSNTKDFYDFYFDKIANPNFDPNFCHIMLKKLEKLGKDVKIVTQNIDGLHQKAGSNQVYELHGSIFRNYSVDTKKFYDLDYILKFKGSIPVTEDNELIKPDVVLYGEKLNDETILKSINAIYECDLLIVAGTSLNVYPAAGLIRYFFKNNLVVINNELLDVNCNLYIQGDINKVSQEIISKIDKTLTI